ncbi:MAG: hypothetical protein ACREIT_00995 [Tepidisphaeraceae bacterium]
MAQLSDFATRGKVTAVKDELVVFQPSDTNYELHLVTAGSGYGGPLNVPVFAYVRGTARKIWTVPSGGNFITPIVGPTRIVQGRVRHVGPNSIVVRAGADVIVELPSDDSAIDLAQGAVGVGSMVNVTLHPGATFELARQPAGAGAAALK